MIVEDRLDRRRVRIGRIAKLREFFELAGSVAVLDQGMDLTGEQFDPGQPADRAVALILMIACDGRMSAGCGRQVGRRQRTVGHSPFDLARRFRSRPRYRLEPRQILSFDRQLKHPPPCCHDIQPRSANHERGYNASPS
jgi:hypothetical protein